MNPAASVKNQDCSIIALDKFIQATRDSGYKGTASAISELVDNSIQAGATRIAISVSRPRPATTTRSRSRSRCSTTAAAWTRSHCARRSDSAAARDLAIVEGSVATGWGFPTRR